MAEEKFGNEHGTATGKSGKKKRLTFWGKRGIMASRILKNRGAEGHPDCSPKTEKLVGRTQNLWPKGEKGGTSRSWQRRVVPLGERKENERTSIPISQIWGGHELKPVQKEGREWG